MFWNVRKLLLLPPSFLRALNGVGYRRVVTYLPVGTASYSGCGLKGLLYIKAPLHHSL